MIKIYRKSSPVDKNCPYKIFLNDMELGTIMDGEKKDFNLRSNSYKVKIVGGGFHSPEINVELADEQIIQLICYPAYKDTKFSKYIYKNVFGGDAIYLKVDKDFYL